MFLSLCLLGLSLTMCLATSCGDPSQCNSQLCPKPAYCPLGTTTEPCGCCKVCLGKEGDYCGGIFATCGLGLNCTWNISQSKGQCERLPGCLLYKSFLAVGISVKVGNCSVCECVEDRHLQCRKIVDCKNITPSSTPPENTLPNSIFNTPPQLSKNNFDHIMS